jgi:hypothetical protein
MKKEIKKIQSLLFMIFFSVSFFTVSAQDTLSVAAEPFTEIKLGGVVAVTLFQSDTHKIVINNKNLSDQLTYKIQDGKLWINGRTNDKAKTSHHIVSENIPVTVYTTKITSIEAEGVSSLDASKTTLTGKTLHLDFSGASKASVNMDVKELYSAFSGACNVTLTGKAGFHELKGMGAANIKAAHLKTSVTIAEVGGAAVAFINASDKLEANISGVAKLHYDEMAKEMTINDEASFEKKIERELEFNELGDSVKVRVGKFDVQIIDSDSTTIRIGKAKIKIDNDGNVEIDKEKKEDLPKFNGHWAGFGLGVNGYMTPQNSLNIPDDYDFLELTYEKSISVSINPFEQSFNLIGEKFGLVTGLGLTWNNYRFDNDVLLDAEADEVAIRITDTSRNYKKSKLTTTYLQIPLLFEFQTNDESHINSFHLTAGITGGWRIGSHTKVVYNKDNKNKERDDFHLNPFQADAMVRIGWGKLNLYGSYSLIELFRDQKGPELYPFNMGIQILTF